MNHYYLCDECGKPVFFEDAVWVDPNTMKASTGKDGRPYHVECAPEHSPNNEYED